MRRQPDHCSRTQGSCCMSFRRSSREVSPELTYSHNRENPHIYCSIRGPKYKLEVYLPFFFIQPLSLCGIYCFSSCSCSFLAWPKRASCALVTFFCFSHIALITLHKYTIVHVMVPRNKGTLSRKSNYDTRHTLAVCNAAYKLL